MECPVCSRWAPSDPATGYDGGDICPDCAAQGWDRTASGQVINFSELAEFWDTRVRMARAPLRPKARRAVGS